ncbi:hypothetical protein FRC17_009076 [Serendipita sp. 399]|nr:hypothetical protein FRC17_009076 [Serendipita sp. 399]
MKEQIISCYTVLGGSLSVVRQAHQFAMSGRDMSRQLLEGRLAGERLEREVGNLSNESLRTYTIITNLKEELSELRVVLNQLRADNKGAINQLQRMASRGWFSWWYESRENAERRGEAASDRDLVKGGDEAIGKLRKTIDELIAWLNQNQASVQHIRRNLTSYQPGDTMRAESMDANFLTLCAELPQYQRAVEEMKDGCPQQIRRHFLLQQPPAYDNAAGNGVAHPEIS